MATLDIYVLSGCANCGHARQVASEVARAYPQVVVQVHDLAHAADIPDSVFAAPTYVLDGRVISLGNPDEATLGFWLEQALAALQSQPLDTGP